MQMEQNMIGGYLWLVNIYITLQGRKFYRRRGGGGGSKGVLDKIGTLRIIIRCSTYRYRVSFKVMCNDVHQMQLTAEPGGHYRCKTESCSQSGSFFWIDRKNSVRYTRIMLAFLCAQSMLGWRQWRDCLTRFTWATRGWVKWSISRRRASLWWLWKVSCFSSFSFVMSYCKKDFSFVL